MYPGATFSLDKDFNCFSILCVWVHCCPPFRDSGFQSVVRGEVSSPTHSKKQSGTFGPCEMQVFADPARRNNYSSIKGISACPH